MIRHLIQTPFPYLSGVAHAGTLSQVIRCDTLCKLANAFESDTAFPYGFHLTGIPVYLKLKRIQADNRAGLSIARILREHGLEHLSPHLPQNRLPESLQEWIKVFVAYYREIFRRMGVKNGFSAAGEYYTTTPLDPGYHRFVNDLYRFLHETGRLRQGQKSLIVCQTCGVALGDHQRAAGEGLGVNTLMLTPGVDLKHRVGYSDVYVRTASGQEYRGPSDQWYHSISPMMADVISNAIRCRCGGLAKIQSVKTLFIAWNEAWKERAQGLIPGLTSSRQVRAALEEGIKDLRDYSFLRSSRGYGSSLDILAGTPYAGMIVDPLGDSMIHTWYAAIKAGELARLEQINPHTPRPSLYISAHDLIPNHLVLMLMMHAIPQFRLGPPPVFFINGYLTGLDSTKMSKSKGNVVTWETLESEGITGQDFRFYICTLADNMDSNSLNTQSIKKAGKTGRLHVSRMHRILDASHASPDTVRVLQKLRGMIRPWQASKADFGIRRIYHSLFYELRQTLGLQDHGLDSCKETIRELLRAYD